LTTPNRFFPIESHTQILFMHFKRDWRYSDITRLLSKRDIREILPVSATIQGHWFSPTFFVFKTKNTSE
jgi:hypothetical protein